MLANQLEGEIVMPNIEQLAYAIEYMFHLLGLLGLSMIFVSGIGATIAIFVFGYKIVKN